MVRTRVPDILDRQRRDRRSSFRFGARTQSARTRGVRRIVLARTGFAVPHNGASCRRSNARRLRHSGAEAPHSGCRRGSRLRPLIRSDPVRRRPPRSRFDHHTRRSHSCCWRCHTHVPSRCKHQQNHHCTSDIARAMGTVRSIRNKWEWRGNHRRSCNKRRTCRKDSQCS